MGMFSRKPKAPPQERQAWAMKWLRRIDPGAAYGVGRYVRPEVFILQEQRETNRLLREQAARQALDG